MFLVLLGAANILQMPVDTYVETAADYGNGREKSAPLRTLCRNVFSDTVKEGRAGLSELPHASCDHV